MSEVLQRVLDVHPFPALVATMSWVMPAWEQNARAGVQRFRLDEAPSADHKVNGAPVQRLLIAQGRSAVSRKEAPSSLVFSLVVAIPG